jgi:hypothetical protein
VRVDLLVPDGPGTTGIDAGPGEGSAEAGGGDASRMALIACSGVRADVSVGRGVGWVAVVGIVPLEPRAVGAEGPDIVSFPDEFRSSFRTFLGFWEQVLT